MEKVKRKYVFWLFFALTLCVFIFTIGYYFVNKQTKNILEKSTSLAISRQESPNKINSLQFEKLNINQDLTFEAHWSSNMKYVYFDHDGGESDTPNPYDVKYGAPIYFKDPIKDGYKFEGYYDQSGSIIHSGDSYLWNTPSVKLKARWKAITYTITLDHNGGTHNRYLTEEVSVTNGSKYDLSHYKPTRSGYTFEGFYNKRTGVSQVDMDGTFTGLGNATYYAHWEEKSITIKWNVDGGVKNVDVIVGEKTYTKSQSDSKDVKSSTKVQVSLNTLNPGFTWYGFEIKNSSGSVATESDYVMDSGYSLKGETISLVAHESITITATAKLEVKVIAVCNSSGVYKENGSGGSVKVGDGVYSGTEKEYYGLGSSSTIYAKCNPVGTFVGFYSDFDESGGKGIAYQCNTMDEDNKIYSCTLNNLTKSSIVYALFDYPFYFLTIGAYSSTNDTFKSVPDEIGGTVQITNSNPSSYISQKVRLGVTVDLIANAKEGYRFIGWYETPQSTEILSEDTTYTHKMEDSDYEICALFMKEFSITLVMGQGVTSLDIAGYSGNVINNGTSHTYHYVYKERVGKITCEIDNKHYKSPIWNFEIRDWIGGVGEEMPTCPQTISSQLNGTEINNIIMPEYDFALTVNCSTKQFDLNVYSYFVDDGNVLKGSKGGLVKINNETPQAQITGYKIKCFSDDATITAYANSGYTFVGWYKTIDLVANTYTDRHDNHPARSGDPVKIDKMDSGGLTYYAIFIKNYDFYVYYDENVENINWDNGNGLFPNDGEYTSGDGCKYKYITLYFGQEIPVLDPELKFGYIFSVWQNMDEQTSLPLNFDVNKLKQEVTVLMPSNDVKLKLITKTTSHAITAKSALIGHDATIGKDFIIYNSLNDFGQVQIEDGQIGLLVSDNYNYGQKVNLTAFPAEGYVLYGWYHIKARSPDDEFYQKIKVNSGNKNYGNIEDYINGESKISSMEDGNSVLSDEIKANDDENYYIAVFIQLFKSEITYDKNIFEIIPPEIKENYHFGENFSVKIKVKDNLENSPTFGGWINNGSILPDDINLSKEYLNFRVLSDIKLEASVDGKLRRLQPFAITERLNGEKILSDEGGIFNYNKETLIPIDYDLNQLIVIHNGFEFGGFWMNETLTEPLPNDRMPDTEESITVYVYFKRLTYKASVQVYTTNKKDNSSLIKKDIGGTCEITNDNLSSIKYGDKVELKLSANLGFEIKGIYLDNKFSYCILDGSTLRGTDRQEYDFTFLMPYKDVIFHVIFQRVISSITIDKNKDDIWVDNVPSEGYYKQTINFEVEVDDMKYKPYDLEIFYFTQETIEGEIKEIKNVINSIGKSFNMPAYDVTINLSAKERTVDLIYDANGGQFDDTLITKDDGTVLGTVTTTLTNYSHYSNSKDKSSEIDGLPIPIRQSFKFLGYNTIKNGTGKYYLTYDENNKMKVFAYDLRGGCTLYAQWLALQPEVEIDYTSNVSGETLIYNGQMQNVLVTRITNENKNLSYIYEWYNAEDDGTIVSSEQILQLRSVNQSGSYYCKVMVKDTDIFATTTTKKITIDKQALTITLPNGTFIGEYKYPLKENDILGIVDCHQLVNGSITFFPSGTEIKYNDDNKERVDLKLTFSKSDDSTIQSEDGRDLSDNYFWGIFDGEITIKEKENNIEIKFGAYERTIDIHYNDVFFSKTLSGASLSIENEYLIIETQENDGVYTNYISDENFSSGELKITFRQPNFYNLHSIHINEIPYTNYTISENVITLPLNLSVKNLLIGYDDYNICNICIYFTRQYIVEFDYNFDEREVLGGYATKTTEKNIQKNGDYFVDPGEFSRDCYEFMGWYCDEEFTKPVPSNENKWNLNSNITVYAKWQLDPKLDNFTLTIYDNDVVVESVNRSYNGNKIRLVAGMKNPYVVLNLTWHYKKGESWVKINSNTVANLKNVADSGEYSFSIKDIIDVGKMTANILISKCEINWDKSLDKTYDAKTSIGTQIMNVNSEELQLIGEFESPDVSIVNGEISSVNLKDGFYLVVNNSSKAENYLLTNDILSGKINPCITPISINENYKYTGNVFECTKTRNIDSLGQKISYTITTQSADVGEYKKDSGLISKVLTVIDSRTDNSINTNNHKVVLSDDSFVNITRAEFNFSFNSEEVYYDSQNHMIYAVDELGNYVTNETKGVETITYYCNNEETDGFTNCGAYSITVVVTGDKNHGDTNREWKRTQTLTINKVVISVQFKNNGEPLQSEIEYTGEDIYNNITAEPSCVKGNYLPSLDKSIHYMGDGNIPTLTQEVLELGSYKVTASLCDENNFEIQGSNELDFKIVKSNIDIQKIIQEINFEEGLSVTYNGTNQKNEVLVLFENFPGILKYRTESVYLQDGENYKSIENSEAKNVGVYRVLVSVMLLDEEHYKLDLVSPVAVKLEITKYIIDFSSRNIKQSITKVYDGTNILPDDAQINIKHNDSVTEHLNVTGEYSTIDVSDNIKILYANLVDSEQYLVSNYQFTINDGDISGQITKRPVVVDIQHNAIFPPNNEYTLLITKDNNSKYISGMIDTEYLEFDVVAEEVENKTEDIIEFPVRIEYSANKNIAYIDLNSVVAKCVNNDSTAHLSNYNITFKGAIKLVKDCYVVELESTNFVYSGKKQEVKIILSNNTSSNVYTYDYDLGKFHSTDPNDTKAYSLSITNNDPSKSSDFIDAGKYDLTISVGETGDFFFDGTNTKANKITFKNIEITKYPLKLKEQLRILKYGDDNNRWYLGEYNSTSGLAPESDDDFILYMEFNAPINDIGDYPINSKNCKVVCEKIKGNIENYEITFYGTLTIIPAKLDVIITAPENLTYNGEEYKNRFTLKFEKDGDEVNIDIDDREIVFYHNDMQVDTVKDAGEYNLLLSSKKYMFKKIVDDTTGEYSHTLSYPFEILRKKLTITFNSIEDFEYDATERTLKDPISIYGKIGDDVLNETICYVNKNYEESQTFRNADEYHIKVCIDNSNYYIAEGNEISDNHFTVTPYPQIIQEPKEIWFSKYYGEDDPTLQKTFVSDLKEQLTVQFERAEGEDVGQYKLYLTSFADNSSQASKNYSLNFSRDVSNNYMFRDTHKAFEILPYDNDQGNLIISLKNNIKVTYNPNINYSTLDLNDYEGYFDIKNDNTILDKRFYNLTAEFNFASGTIKDVGEYSLFLKSSRSTSHSGNITFDDNNYKFIIKAYGISPIYSAILITKEYDNTSKVIFGEALKLPAEIDTTIHHIQLLGNYIEDGIDTVDVGEYIIKVYLGGEDKNNYSLNFSKNLFGSITPKHITVVPIDEAETAFDKEYDGTNAVMVEKLKLYGAVIGADNNFSGTYADNSARDNDYDITFTLSNKNYVLDGKYTGKINKRKLFVTEDSNVNKEYDGTDSVIIENINLEPIVEEDDVRIADTSKYNSAEVGKRILTIDLVGKDAKNYFVNNLNAKIFDRNITIKYNYGDTEPYIFDFVADGKSITKGATEQNVLYGKAIGMLTSASREGYDFMGWFSDISCENEITETKVIDNINANDYIYNLYAKWKIKVFDIDFKLFTENLANNEYTLSNIGGKIVINETERTEKSFTERFDYYSSGVSAIASDGFTINDIKINGISKGYKNIDEIIFTSNMEVAVYFARKSVTLTIDLIKDNVIGYDSSEWTKKGTVISLPNCKAGRTIILPNVSVKGNTFNGYAKIGSDEVIYSIDNLSLKLLEDTHLYAVWNEKIIPIYYDNDGGTITDPSFLVEGKNYKNVKFGETIPLPSIKKGGYRLEKFSLYIGTVLKIDDMTDNVLLDFESTENIIVKAVWTAIKNTFKISQSLDASKYESGEYRQPETDVLSFDYAVDLNEFVDYTQAFKVESGKNVIIKYDMCDEYNSLYAFEYWKIGNTILYGGSNDVDGVNYFVDGTKLTISNYGWENTCPDICAYYEPKEFEVNIEIYHKDYLADENNLIKMGIYESDGNYITYANSKIQLNCKTKENYVFDNESFCYTGVTEECEINKTIISLQYVCNNVNLHLEFHKNGYKIEIIKFAPEAIKDVYYDINDSGTFLPVSATDKSLYIFATIGDKVNIEVELNYGYKLLDTDGFVRSDNGVSIEKLSTNKIKVSGFTGSFSITINTERCRYDLSVEKVLLKTDLSNDSEILQTQYETTETNTATSSAYYAVYEVPVTLEASVETENISINETPVVSEKYEFVGWYELNKSKLQHIGNNQDYKNLIYQYKVTKDVEIYAVFKDKSYVVEFKYDHSQGKLLADDGTQAVLKQNVNYDKSLNSPVKAIANNGYVFTGWEIKYTYSNNEEINERYNKIKIDSEYLYNIKADIVCTAMFEEKSVTITVKSLYIGGESITKKLELIYKEQESSEEQKSYEELFLNVKAHQDIEIKAKGELGYGLTNWCFSDADGINAISQSYDKDTRCATLKLQIIGEQENYTITACYDKVDINVELTLIDNNNEMSDGGVISVDSYSYGAKTTLTGKIEETIEAEIKIYNGYFVDIENFINLLILPDDDVHIEVIPQNVSGDFLEVYAQILTIQISGYTTDCSIKLKLAKKSTELRFAKLTDYYDNIYELNDFTGRILFGTTDISLYDDDVPRLSREGQEREQEEEYQQYLNFLGWAINKNGTNLIINSDGEVINPWSNYTDDYVDLYPIFEIQKIKININILPNEAVSHDDYYMKELFNNLSINKPETTLGGDYYFYIGSRFGLTLPTVKEKYIFSHFEYLDIIDNKIQWVKMNQGYLSNYNADYTNSSLFTIQSYSRYQYSDSSVLNKQDQEFSFLEDSTMYITIVYSIQYTLKVSNFYTSNCISNPGGSVEVVGKNSLINYVDCGESIQVKANVYEGYELIDWKVNEIYQSNSSLIFTIENITEPITIEAVFRGKVVKIKLEEAEHGVANNIPIHSSISNGELNDDATYSFHVGDLVTLSAISYTGYDFKNKWLHVQNDKKYEGLQNYYVQPTDSVEGYITLKPLFDMRDIQIKVIMNYGQGYIIRNGMELPVREDGNRGISSFINKYFEDISFEIVANQRYKFKSVHMILDTNSTNPYDLKDFVINNQLTISSVLNGNDIFLDAKKIVFKIEFAEAYWSDVVKEKNIVEKMIDGTYVVLKDFEGKGRMDDPYRIETKDDISLLSFVISNRILQLQQDKMAYNSENTYYEINLELDLSSKFWIPIGTQENPFNATLIIYRLPQNIEVDEEMKNFETDFNKEDLRATNKLIGYFGVGKIDLKVKSYISIIIATSIIIGSLIVLISSVIFIAKKRKKKLDTFDENINLYYKGDV